MGNMDSKTPKKLQKSGAIPKSSKATKSNNKGEGEDFQKVSNWYPKPSEIVDDVLYIAGPLKNEVRKQQRDSLDVNQEFVNQLLALPLIPSDKFYPVNTLSKRKQKKASNNNASTSGHSGVTSSTNPNSSAAAVATTTV